MNLHQALQQYHATASAMLEQGRSANDLRAWAHDQIPGLLEAFKATDDRSLGQAVWLMANKLPHMSAPLAEGLAQEVARRNSPEAVSELVRTQPIVSKLGEGVAHELAYRHAELFPGRKLSPNHGWGYVPVPEDHAKVADFWHGYEEKVKAKHFAVVQAHVQGAPVSITDHRGNSASAVPGELPGLDSYAQRMQNVLLLHANKSRGDDGAMVQVKDVGGVPHVKVYRGVGGDYAQAILKKLGHSRVTDTGTNGAAEAVAELKGLTPEQIERAADMNPGWPRERKIAAHAYLVRVLDTLGPERSARVLRGVYEHPFVKSHLLAAGVNEPSAQKWAEESAIFMNAARLAHGRDLGRPKAVVADKSVVVPTTHLSSWTVSPSQAKVFAETREFPDQAQSHGVVLSQWRPVSDVLHAGFLDAFPGHKHAHPGEDELVLKSKTGKMKVSSTDLHLVQTPFGDWHSQEQTKILPKPPKAPRQPKAPPTNLGKSEAPYQTGVPVSMKVTHRRQKTQNFGSRYCQDIEPAGRYVVEGHWGTPGRTVEAGNHEVFTIHDTVDFKSPLVVEHGGYGPEGWKARVSQQFGGKKGKALSQALLAAGHDGVITHNGPETSEIVDLRPLQKAEPDVFDGVSHEEAQQLAQQLGVDLTQFDVEEWRKGVEHEREHADVSREPLDIAKIAWSHLREDPAYYTRLEQCVEGQPVTKSLPALALAASMLASPMADKPAKGPAAVEHVQEGLHPALHAIAALESNSGRYTKHKDNSRGALYTAHGALGLKPITAHEEYTRSPDLQKRFPGLDQTSFVQKFTQDPTFYNHVASSHWQRLQKRFGSDAKAAYAWRWGWGSAAKATDQNVADDPYVKSYLQRSLNKAEVPGSRDVSAPGDDLEKMAREVEQPRMTPHNKSEYEGGLHSVETYEVPAHQRPRTEREDLKAKPLYHHVVKDVPYSGGASGKQSVMHILDYSPSAFTRYPDASSSAIDLGDGKGVQHGETAVRPSMQGQGYGPLLYQRMLAYHGRMLSDDSVSPNANKVWDKVLAMPGVTGQKAPIDTLDPHWAETREPFTEKPVATLHLGGHFSVDQLREYAKMPSDKKVVWSTNHYGERRLMPVYIYPGDGEDHAPEAKAALESFAQWQPFADGLKKAEPRSTRTGAMPQDEQQVSDIADHISQGLKVNKYGAVVAHAPDPSHVAHTTIATPKGARVPVTVGLLQDQSLDDPRGVKGAVRLRFNEWGDLSGGHVNVRFRHTPGQDHGELMSGIRSVLSHEFTHAADPGLHEKQGQEVFNRPAGAPKVLPSNFDPQGQETQHEAFKRYVNEPTEVTARIQQIVREVRDHKSAALIQEAHREYAQDPNYPPPWHPTQVAEWSQTWQHVAHHLTPENRKRVLRAIADTTTGLAEGRVQPIKKSQDDDVELGRHMEALAHRHIQADRLPRDRRSVLEAIKQASGIDDHDLAQADSAYVDWKARGRKGPKLEAHVGGEIDSFSGDSNFSSLLEAFEHHTRHTKTWRELRPVLDQLREVPGFDKATLPHEVQDRHLLQDIEWDQLRSGHIPGKKMKVYETPDFPPVTSPPPAPVDDDIEDLWRSEDSLRGLPPALLKLFHAARALADVQGPISDSEAEDLRLQFWLEGEDYEAAALWAVGLDPENDNRESLRALVSDDIALPDGTELKKAAKELSGKVVGMTPSAHDLASEIEAALPTAKPSHLEGRHTAGSFFVELESGTWLLKTAEAAGPIQGLEQERPGAAAREAGFYAVAALWGLAQDLPRTELVSIGGTKAAAIQFLPQTRYQAAQEPHKALALMEAYRQQGRLWQWAVLDYVLGNGDRHAHNVLVDVRDQKVKLIDHGSSMAGDRFSPSKDWHAFTPWYLRYQVPSNDSFNRMPLPQKLRVMPALPTHQLQRQAMWLRSLRPEALAETLRSFGFDPRPMVQRLEEVQHQASPSDLGGYVNRLWVQP